MNEGHNSSARWLKCMATKRKTDGCVRKTLHQSLTHMDRAGRDETGVVAQLHESKEKLVSRWIPDEMAHEDGLVTMAQATW
jgi:hypothetical protein